VADFTNTTLIKGYLLDAFNVTEIGQVIQNAYNASKTISGEVNSTALGEAILNYFNST
jgi:hypothetical protein